MSSASSPLTRIHLCFAMAIAGALFLAGPGCGASSPEPEELDGSAGIDDEGDGDTDSAPPKKPEYPDVDGGDEEDAALDGFADASKKDAGDAGKKPDGGPGTCNEQDTEPNDTEATAEQLGDISDCDSAGGSIVGTFKAAGEIDWFAFHGKDQFGCSVNPTATTQADVRICMYASCGSGGTGIASCPKGSAETGGTGCCVDGPGTVEAEVNCPGINDSSDVEIKVTPLTPGMTCTQYSIDYHY